MGPAPYRSTLCPTIWILGHGTATWEMQLTIRMLVDTGWSTFASKSFNAHENTLQKAAQTSLILRLMFSRPPGSNSTTPTNHIPAAVLLDIQSAVNNTRTLSQLCFQISGRNAGDQRTCMYSQTLTY
jgi:hypothetical protein